MAYRYGNRSQISLFPASIEDYVSTSDPVRAYDAFIDHLDLKELGLDLDEHKIGSSEYDPVAMVKLIVYGYSYGVLSGRKLERALHHNVSFMWLCGGIQPDFRTINRFRRKHREFFKKILLCSARMCIDLDLVEGNILFVDGSKIAANASLDNKWDLKRCDRVLKALEKRIESLLEECDKMAEAEETQCSLVKLHEELTEKERLFERVKSLAERVSSEPKPAKSGTQSINTIDADSKPMHSKKGSMSGFNVQAVTDGKSGIIVSVDAVNDRNDVHQLEPQIANAETVLEKNCETAVADSGYHSSDALLSLESRGTDTIVPTPRQSSDKEVHEFDKSNFVYDNKSDSYRCPCDHILRRTKTDTKEQKIHYTISDSNICKTCIHWGSCTKAKIGRTVIRFFNEEKREELVNKYELPSSQKIYSKRKEVAERPFAYIKHVMNYKQFLLRGFSGVKAELSLLCAGFNIKRALTELGGVENFLLQLKLL